MKEKKIGQIAGNPLLNAFTIASIAIAAALLVILIISTIIMLGKEFSSYHNAGYAYGTVSARAEDATDGAVLVERESGTIYTGMFLERI